MDLTVVINCSDDFHVFETLRSIDESVDVVCSITPNRDIERRLLAMGVRYVITPKGNRAETTNEGIRAAKHEVVLLMDSDSLLTAGTIRRAYDLLARCDVVDCQVRFLHSNSLASKLVALCREFDNCYDSPVYKPGLAFRRSVCDRIGTWFNPECERTDDADFTYRLKAHHLRVVRTDFVGVMHTSIPFMHHVRSCIDYGVGDMRRRAILGQDTKTFSLRHELARYAVFVSRHGLRPLPFMVFSDALYYAGHTWEFLRLLATRISLKRDAQHAAA